jgi:hypothetical protein
MPDAGYELSLGPTVATATIRSRSAFMAVNSSTTDHELRLMHCPGCGYDLSGLPREHWCPECGFRYQTSMFDLPPHRGIGRLIRVRRHVWIDWIVRPLLYGVAPVVILVAAIRLGVPVDMVVRPTAGVAVFGVGLYVGTRITMRLDERRSRQGMRKPRATRTADHDGITHRHDSGLIQRFRWRSYRKVMLRRLGDYPETGDSLWRLKLHRRLTVGRLLQNNISVTLACDERTACTIRDRAESWIRAASCAQA